MFETTTSNPIKLQFGSNTPITSRLGPDPLEISKNYMIYIYRMAIFIYLNVGKVYF